MASHSTFLIANCSTSPIYIIFSECWLMKVSLSFTTIEQLTLDAVKRTLATAEHFRVQNRAQTIRPGYEAYSSMEMSANQSNSESEATGVREWMGTNRFVLLSKNWQCRRNGPRWRNPSEVFRNNADVYYQNRTISHRSINKCSKSIKLLRYENNICDTEDINAVYNSFRWDNCNKCFPILSNLRRHIQVCENLVRNKYPSSAYQLKETMFENVSNSGKIVAENFRLVNNFVAFDFESICVAETTTDTSSTENTPTT